MCFLDKVLFVISELQGEESGTGSKENTEINYLNSLCENNPLISSLSLTSILLLASRLSTPYEPHNFKNSSSSLWSKQSPSGWAPRANSSSTHTTFSICLHCLRKISDPSVGGFIQVWVSESAGRPHASALPSTHYSFSFSSVIFDAIMPNNNAWISQ